MHIDTPRLRLRAWRDEDRNAFALMNTDPEVMADLGGPIGRAKSDAKLDRYAAAIGAHGFGRWLLESRDGDFLGYAGVMPGPAEHPLGRHFEVGWRLKRSAWGFGFASEGARAALADAFERSDLDEVLSYTARDNARSRAVMERLCLKRDKARDFTASYDSVGEWCGLVWVARR